MRDPLMFAHGVHASGKQKNQSRKNLQTIPILPTILPHRIVDIVVSVCLRPEADVVPNARRRQLELSLGKGRFPLRQSGRHKGDGLGT